MEFYPVQESCGRFSINGVEIRQRRGGRAIVKFPDGTEAKVKYRWTYVDGSGTKTPTFKHEVLGTNQTFRLTDVQVGYCRAYSDDEIKMFKVKEKVTMLKGDVERATQTIATLQAANAERATALTTLEAEVVTMQATVDAFNGEDAWAVPEPVVEAVPETLDMAAPAGEDAPVAAEAHATDDAPTPVTDPTAE